MGRLLNIVVASVVSVVALILFITLMSLSFEVLNYDEWGIRYNKVSRVLSTTVEDEGRHYIQPGERYFVFKNTIQTMNFQPNDDGDPDETSFPCTTVDGLDVVVDATVQFQVRRQK